MNLNDVIVQIELELKKVYPSCYLSLNFKNHFLLACNTLYISPKSEEFKDIAEKYFLDYEINGHKILFNLNFNKVVDFKILYNTFILAFTNEELMHLYRCLYFSSYNCQKIPISLINNLIKFKYKKNKAFLNAAIKEMIAIKKRKERISKFTLSLFYFLFFE